MGIARMGLRMVVRIEGECDGAFEVEGEARCSDMGARALKGR